MEESKDEKFQTKDTEYLQDQEMSLLHLKNEVETNETQKEIMFKTAIRATFMSLKSLNDIPYGGKKIEYPKGIKFQPGDLPELFDIQPKKITEPQKSIRFVLGKRSFDVEPIMGKVQDIFLTEEALVIETTFKNITYNKVNKLPDLCRRLRKT